MKVVNVIFENGKFFKIVRSAVQTSPVAVGRVITSIDENGVASYKDAMQFPRTYMETKHPATWFQWLAWKAFKVCPQ
jgi:hypothetical protein